MMYTCNACGHMGITPAEIEPISLSLADTVGPTLAEKLSPKIDGVNAPGTRTLFLSVRESYTLFEYLSHSVDLDRFMSETKGRVFESRILPVLKTIDCEFKILGSVSYPSSIKLAIQDLTQAWAIFTFIAIEDRPDVEQRLKELGLESLLVEGMVGTIDNRVESA